MLFPQVFGLFFHRAQCCAPQIYVQCFSFQNPTMVPIHEQKQAGTQISLACLATRQRFTFATFQPLILTTDETLSLQHLHCVAISRLAARHLVIVTGNGCTQLFPVPTTFADNVQLSSPRHHFGPQRVKWCLNESHI